MQQVVSDIKLPELLLYEDEFCFVLDKPSGILSIPDREGKEASLKSLLRARYGEIFTVHRLDRDTSGLILFARNETAHKHFSLQFENRQTVKIYHGLVLGSPAVKKGRIEAPIAEHPARNGTMIVHRKGKESLTDYEVLEDFGKYAWVQFRIHTGRTHQIRVHAREIGHPIVCDTLYGDGKPLLLSSLKHKKFKLSKNELEERPLLHRLALHASQLELLSPGGKEMKLAAPLPRELKAVLNQLRKLLPPKI